ncbi:protransforming growth factor alpha [Antechinus flavipes]|uniref:protransforming growth factor alpha n=1 Tax=Antechinus flavipes TaxID=38775 RepID=UPI0022366B60|nr:protransforming growth factor alpha [Antechinus flavipes]
MKLVSKTPSGFNFPRAFFVASDAGQAEQFPAASSGQCASAKTAVTAGSRSLRGLYSVKIAVAATAAYTQPVAPPTPVQASRLVRWWPFCCALAPVPLRSSSASFPLYLSPLAPSRRWPTPKRPDWRNTQSPPLPPTNPSPAGFPVRCRVRPAAAATAAAAAAPCRTSGRSRPEVPSHLNSHAFCDTPPPFLSSPLVFQPEVPTPCALRGAPPRGGRVVSRAQVAKWRRGDGNRLPISAQPSGVVYVCARVCQKERELRETRRERAQREEFLLRSLLLPLTGALEQGLSSRPTSPSPRAEQRLSHLGAAGWGRRLQRLQPAWKMVTPAGELALIGLGILLAVCQALENTTSALNGPPMAAAVVSHFHDCPDSHSQFCFHGTCRFLVEEEKPACKCHSGYVGARCEHADLLAVVAANQKKQTITALVVVSIVALVVLIGICVLIHCCRIRRPCEWCRGFVCQHEKPSDLLKGGTTCCRSETVV